MQHNYIALVSEFCDLLNIGSGSLFRWTLFRQLTLTLTLTLTLALNPMLSCFQLHDARRPVYVAAAFYTAVAVE